MTHRHPEFWDNPEGFEPERFAPEAARRRHRLPARPAEVEAAVTLRLRASMLMRVDRAA